MILERSLDKTLITFSLMMQVLVSFRKKGMRGRHVRFDIKYNKLSLWDDILYSIPTSLLYSDWI